MSDKQARARCDRENYAKTMIAGRVSDCIEIEKRYDLFGYPPEQVCIGLSAACDDRDIEAAIEAHMREPA